MFEKYKKELFSWNNVSCCKILLLVVIGFIMNLMIFHRKYIPNKIASMMDRLDSCVAGHCESGLCKAYTNGRSSGYFHRADLHPSYNSNCILTGWEVSHFFWHMFVGYFFNIYLSTGISVGYEIYEKYAYKCESWNDLVINLAGCCVGSYFRAFY